MHCDHKRVWEFTDTSTVEWQESDQPTIYMGKWIRADQQKDSLLANGWEPISAQPDWIAFKRLTPCQTCIEEQEREKKHLDDYKNNFIIKEPYDGF